MRASGEASVLHGFMHMFDTLHVSYMHCVYLVYSLYSYCMQRVSFRFVLYDAIRTVASFVSLATARAFYDSMCLVLRRAGRFFLWELVVAGLRHLHQRHVI